MLSLYHPTQIRTCTKIPRRNAAKIFCSVEMPPPSQSTTKVIIIGATKEIGRKAIQAVTKARGMELAGAIDSQRIGEDAGEISGMEEPLEIPVLNDLTMVLGSIAQSRATGVVVDFSEPSTVYDNVKQAAAFGLSSIVYIPKIEPDTIAELSAFCEKASTGCLVAPTLSIGSVLLQQAAIQASFHYSNVEIVKSRPNPLERKFTFKTMQQRAVNIVYLSHSQGKKPKDLPSQDATQIANNISDLGQIYNREDMESGNPARGQVIGEDGVRVHSMVLPSGIGRCRAARAVARHLHRKTTVAQAVVVYHHLIYTPLL